MREIHPSGNAWPQLCHAAASQLGTAPHSTVCPLSLSPGAVLELRSQLLCHPSPCLSGHVKDHRERPSPLSPRNLKGEADTGDAPGESLWETMDVGTEKREGGKNMKNVLSVIWLFFCEEGAPQNFTDQYSSLN